MSLEIEDGVIYVKGHCRVEEAENLVGLLRQGPAFCLDLSACDGLHAAVVQAILAFECVLVGEPTDNFLRDLLVPALAPNGEVTL